MVNLYFIIASTELDVVRVTPSELLDYHQIVRFSIKIQP